MESIIQEAVLEVNENFSPNRLVRKLEEQLPTDKRQLSAFRTRVGFSLENAVGDAINGVMVRKSKELVVTENMVNEFPDLIIRNQDYTPTMRIEVKAVDMNSEEQAARLDVPTSQILKEDYLLAIAWRWRDQEGVSYPFIEHFLFIKVKPLAVERDRRLRLLGGCIRQNKPMVLSKKTNKLIPDNNNYGKFLRLVHKDRRSFELDKEVVKYLEFIANFE